jgi:hypothetical protein
MKKLIALSLFIISTLGAVEAQETDLVLTGEKWIATHTGHICAAFGETVSAPQAFANLNVKFEKITTDSTLDNGLLKATFEEDGITCRYSALIFADNRLATIRLIESKAFASEGKSDCAQGKSILDAAFESTNYLYWGHPHNLTVMVPVAGATAVCNSELVGVNFVVSGRVK